MVKEAKKAIATVSSVGEVSSLRKAVEAIAVKPHAGKITLLTRKINNVLLAEAQAQGIQATTYRIPLSKLCAKADYDSTNMQLVKEQLRRMASTTVEWNVGAKGARRWGVTSLIEVEIVEEGNRCFIEWGYPVKFKEKLLAPEIYARITLQMQNSFRSSAALALYEICVRYIDSPGQLTMRMPWEEWRPTLTGVPDGDPDATYLEYKYFKRDVLKPAVAEINSLPVIEIEVELIEHKNGRSISELQFKVQKKTQSGLELDEPNLFDLSLITRIVALGFTRAQAEKIYSDHEENKVRAALDYTETRLKRSPPLESPQGYYRDALAKGYGLVAPGLVAGEKHKAIEMDSRQPPATKGSKPGDVTQLLAEAWWSERRQAARATFDALDAENQAHDIAEFAKTALPKHLAKKWRDLGLTNPMCASAFARWLMRDIPEPSDVELLQFGLAKGLLATRT